MINAEYHSFDDVQVYKNIRERAFREWAMRELLKKMLTPDEYRHVPEPVIELLLSQRHINHSLSQEAHELCRHIEKLEAELVALKSSQKGQAA